MIRTIWIECFLVASLSALASAARADVFNLPAGQRSLEFVTVGDPGNAADPTVMSDRSSGYGAVSYVYRFGKYDVTAAQYTQFLNAVAATDTYGLYNASLAHVSTDPLNFSIGSGIFQSGSPGNFTYSVGAGRENFPVNWTSWGDAARFANWLQNGQPTGAQGPGTTETGAYTLNGATSTSALLAVSRNPSATYFLPSENEWYKAAYYKGGSTNAGYWAFATRSNAAPSNTLSSTGANNENFNSTGNFLTPNYTDPTNHLTSVGAFASSPGPYGTYDQGGDVEQWTDTRLFTRVARGSPFDNTAFDRTIRNDLDPTDPNIWYVGFRVASVPEPNCISLLLVGMGSILLFQFRRRRLMHGSTGG